MDPLTQTCYISKYRFLLAHTNRHHNGIIFIKCGHSTCPHCSENPVRCHYSIQCPEEIPEADSYLPSFQDRTPITLDAAHFVQICFFFCLKLKKETLSSVPLERDVCDGSTYTDLLSEYRHYNAVNFMKCGHVPAPTALRILSRLYKEVFSFLKNRKMSLFYPMPSKEHVGRYCTYLEMCSKKLKEIPEADSYLPSFQDKNLGCYPLVQILFYFCLKLKKDTSSIPPKETCSSEHKSSPDSEEGQVYLPTR